MTAIHTHSCAEQHDETRAAPADRLDDAALEMAIAAACRKIPPLWPLRHFVAVNPYLGFTWKPFAEAAGEVDRIFHAPSFLPLEHYRERFRAGRIDRDDLIEAIREAAQALDRADLLSDGCAPAIRELLEGRGSELNGRAATWAEAVDAAAGNTSDYEGLVRDQTSKWFAARFDAGQAAWSQPWGDLPLYSAWRETAAIDLAPELAGLRGFRSFVRALPADPRQAISTILQSFGPSPQSVEGFLARSLASIAGWAGYAAYLQREATMRGQSDDSLVHVLAIRLAYDGGVRNALGGEPTWNDLFARVPPPSPALVDRPWTELELGMIWQLALEAGYRRRLIGKLDGGGVSALSSERPQLQAVFCIDVRSELLRRHLEERSPRIQTIGFAGFFGFPIEFVPFGDELGGARCPALLVPPFRISEVAPEGSGVEQRLLRENERHRALKATRLSTVSAFPFVETAGQLFSLRLLSDSLGWTRPWPDGRLFPPRARQNLTLEIEPSGAGGAGRRSGLDLQERTALAEAALRNMGLTRDFAEIVLLCGHGSSTTNNPYGSGLDCGACGGHAGNVNARVAAAVLNDPKVRSELVSRGIDIPEDTCFVAGLHDTTTDAVELFDADHLSSAARGRIETWLAEAGARTRAERCRRFGSRRNAKRQVERRSRDWSEVRPEWGLARNAAFIAAPRARTRGIDLDGRTFLHDYEHTRDPDGRVLDLILSAPMVVASWINFQYYASSVAPDVFGSGNKALHNVVGRLGVMEGNRSDLKSGLPWQSVHDGSEYVHEPLRLLSIVEAPPERIEAVLSAHPEVAELVSNGWVQLIAIDPPSGAFLRFENDRFVALSGALPS